MWVEVIKHEVYPVIIGAGACRMGLIASAAPAPAREAPGRVHSPPPNHNAQRAQCSMLLHPVIHFAVFSYEPHSLTAMYVRPGTVEHNPRMLLLSTTCC